ncbi:MAG: hypothetical protein Q4G16_09340 [Cruoricaptor ignavus]|nr:hypothetical protein [Cruoricaptor ignavus]
MKKFKTILASALLLGATTAFAQSYKTSGGLLIDFGKGGTAFGPHVKHFFNKNFAVQPEVAFGEGVTSAGIGLLANGGVPDAKGLGWFLGVAPQMWFGDGFSTFVLRPMAGLEMTIPSTPLNIGFDWRPALNFEGDTTFTAGRFAFTLRYVFSK